MSAKYSRIISTGSALPAARITNEDLARRLAAEKRGAGPYVSCCGLSAGGAALPAAVGQHYMS